jgi:hypothetical protein
MTNKKKELSRLVYLICLVVVAACNPVENSDGLMEKIHSITSEELAEEKLSYYSDYFSFTGSDERGHVFFAMDNNRGQDGDAWQAEHYLTMYDQATGWVELEGNGDYVNTDEEQINIPDSSAFKFEGNAEEGIHISSTVNDINLFVDPIPSRYQLNDGLSWFWMGSLPATLNWKSRQIKGRLIYEGLYYPGFNRLSRTYVGFFNNFNGFYLNIEDIGDLYIHTEEAKGEKVGFLFLENTYKQLHSIDIDVIKSEQALGSYRWPVQWQGSFMVDKEVYEFTATIENRKTMGNWFIGGLSMGIIKGELKSKNRTYSLTGLGELII